MKIDTEKIKPDPHQPRKTFDREDLKALAGSYKSKTEQIAPILIDENNVIIVGERRWRAAKMAGLRTVACTRRVGLGKLERMKIQSDEDIHDKPIPLEERDEFWAKMYKEGNFKNYTEFAEFLNVSPDVVGNAFDRLEFKKTARRRFDVSPTVITETRGLPDTERIKVLELAEKKEMGQRRIRQVLDVIAKAPPSIRKKVILGKIEPEKAEEIIEEEEKEPVPVSETRVGFVECPLCKKKLKIIHRDPRGHKIEEVRD